VQGHDTLPISNFEYLALRYAVHAAGVSKSCFDFSFFCVSDERDAVQKKTFTKWINQHLIKVDILKT